MTPAQLHDAMANGLRDDEIDAQDRCDEIETQPAPLVTVLPYMGPPQPTKEQIKRRNAKSPEAYGTGTWKTQARIREDWNER